MLILGIESSCDDTAAAVLEASSPTAVTVRSSVVASQENIHREFGGVVPELASREHVRAIAPTVERALELAGVTLGEIDGIAVTRGPGLIGSLLVGLLYAKGLAQALGKPFVGVNHIEGHILAPLLEHRVEMPFLALVVSGGHTALFKVEDFGSYRCLGTTRDDAAGEAFDKVAKLMGLGYPGGKVIDEMAQRGNAGALRFPRARVRGAPLDMSFSGLKTAMAISLRKGSLDGCSPDDVAASFQEAVIDTLLRPTVAAARASGVKTVALTGGVAANSRLRRRLAEVGESAGFKVVAPALKYCTDNAAMIAMAGSYRLLRGEFDQFDLDAAANLPL